MVFERSINVIIVLQLTIFRSQVHCHLLTNPLEVLHKTGHTHFQYITMGDASTPSSHTSHQVHPTASISTLSWIGPFPLANHVFPTIYNMPATGTSPSVPIFKLLIFLSSAASSELHSFTPILIKCLNFTSSAKPHFLLSVSTSPETSYLQITLPPLLLVATGWVVGKQEERPPALHNFYCRLLQSSQSSSSGSGVACAAPRLPKTSCCFHQGLGFWRGVRWRTRVDINARRASELRDSPKPRTKTDLDVTTPMFNCCCSLLTSYSSLNQCCRFRHDTSSMWFQIPLVHCTVLETKRGVHLMTFEIDLIQ